MTVIPGSNSLQAPLTLTDRLREAMASFPSGVTIATTTDGRGQWSGFTASSFCSVSMEPPLVLVCLAKSARSHSVFLAARSWVIHLIGSQHAELARRFATAGVDKFAGGRFAANSDGNPVFAEACAVLECTAHARYDGGDHTILVGEVTAVDTWEQSPAVYFQRQFHSLPPGADSTC